MEEEREVWEVWEEGGRKREKGREGERKKGVGGGREVGGDEGREKWRRKEGEGGKEILWRRKSE